MTALKNIFITGFPGFIAGRLVERLASPERRILVLVQEQFVDKAQSELRSIASRADVAEGMFRVVTGDITRPDLGMSAEDAAEVRETTTDVFHLAAIYDLAVTREVAFTVNVEGTKNVGELALAMPRLVRYNYVSTCYVAGKRTGLIREDELQHSAGFRNFYEESKYYAESAVAELRSQIPVTVFRPSVVVGDSRTGETAKYDGIYYLIHYLRRAPGLLRFINVGNDDVRLNLVPVDFVVDGIASLAFDEEAAGKTLALADPSPLSTADLFNVIAKELSGKGSAIEPPPALVERFLRLPFSPPLTGLPHSGVPYFFLAQTYDTSISGPLLSKHGVRCPQFDDYVGNLIRFVEMHPEL